MLAQAEGTIQSILHHYESREAVFRFRSVQYSSIGGAYNLQSISAIHTDMRLARM